MNPTSKFYIFKTSLFRFLYIDCYSLVTLAMHLHGGKHQTTLCIRLCKPVIEAYRGCCVCADHRGLLRNYTLCAYECIRECANSHNDGKSLTRPLENVGRKNCWLHAVVNVLLSSYSSLFVKIICLYKYKDEGH